MTKTLDPFYATGVANIAARATAAKTTMTDNVNAVLAFTAGAEGAVVNSFKFRALGTFTDTIGYAFTSSDAGVTLHQKAAVRATGATISTTVAPVAVDLGPSFDAPWELSANERVYVAISVALAAGFEFEGSAENF